MFTIMMFSLELLKREESVQGDCKDIFWNNAFLFPNISERTNQALKTEVDGRIERTRSLEMSCQYLNLKTISRTLKLM